MATMRVLCSLLVLSFTAHGAALEEKTQVNPIRKIINLLEGMQKEIEAEGEKEKKTLRQFHVLL
jgi:hypothetical protein